MQIDNLLSSRNFEVRVGTTLSELQGQEEGVLHGSILSVTLFRGVFVFFRLWLALSVLKTAFIAFPVLRTLTREAISGVSGLSLTKAHGLFAWLSMYTHHLLNTNRY